MITPLWLPSPLFVEGVITCQGFTAKFATGGGLQYRGWAKIGLPRCPTIKWRAMQSYFDMAHVNQGQSRG